MQRNPFFPPKKQAKNHLNHIKTEKNLPRGGLLSKVPSVPWREAAAEGQRGHWSTTAALSSCQTESRGICQQRKQQHYYVSPWLFTSPRSDYIPSPITTETNMRAQSQDRHNVQNSLLHCVTAPFYRVFTHTLWCTWCSREQNGTGAMAGAFFSRLFSSWALKL